MYPGDSLQKRIARFYVHNFALRLLGRTAHHHFLLSREGGDIATLRGLNVSDERMTGYDIDLGAVQESILKHDFRRACCGDIANELQRYRSGLSHVYLDFCQPISSATMTTIMRCWDKMRSGDILSATFLKGRDTADEMTGINILRRQYPELSPAQARAVHVQRCVLPSGYILGTIEYQSKRKNSPGSPMLICQFRKGCAAPMYGSIALTETKAREERNRIIQEYDAKHAALLLNTTPRHIAAWKAVATRSRA